MVRRPRQQGELLDKSHAVHVLRWIGITIWNVSLFDTSKFAVALLELYEAFASLISIGYTCIDSHKLTKNKWHMLCVHSLKKRWKCFSLSLSKELTSVMWIDIKAMLVFEANDIIVMVDVLLLSPDPWLCLCPQFVEQCTMKPEHMLEILLGEYNIISQTVYNCINAWM